MNNKITDKQALVIVILFTIGTSIANTPGRIAKENAWISIILAFIIFIPIALMYSRILEKFPGKNAFQICDIVFGKFFGKVFNIIFTFHFFVTVAALLRNLGDFIYGVGPPETPMEVNMIFLGLLGILGLYGGINILGRWSIITFPIILFILLIPFPFLIPQMKIDRVLPVMYNGMSPVIKGALSTLSFPITQSFVFLMVFENIRDAKSFKKILLRGVFIGTLILLVVVSYTLLIIGGENYLNSYLTTFVTLRRLTIGKLFERVEIIILQTFVYTIFLKFSIMLIATMKGIGHIFNLKNYKAISPIIIFLAANIGYILFSNSMEGIEFIINVWPPYALTFQVVLPFILWIISELKTKFSLR